RSERRDESTTGSCLRWSRQSLPREEGKVRICPCPAQHRAHRAPHPPTRGSCCPPRTSDRWRKNSSSAPSEAAGSPPPVTTSGRSRTNSRLESELGTRRDSLPEQQLCTAETSVATFALAKQ